MAVFKCKMCGGDLNVTEGMTVCECEFCGTNQTVPNADNEKKANLFNRANRLRFNNEFDAAAGVFQSIIAEFPEEAEAYWGLCLCKYGIEYVDDPATGKKIPTCHRTSFESIAEDENFELAQEYADAVAKKLYREEAKEIDRLQRAILDIVKNEKPYDIFICYKETAEDGQRTKDSVLAQDMYDALTEKGYKVFFARVTLEDKLGQEYEPYIFAALTSSRIMLAVGTSYDYFSAVWVKNEWSRFLDLMKQDKSKVLIPCYADIDPFDMPKEFKNLQGQDMGKVGFIQDLVRGIGKIIPLEKKQPAAAQQVIVQQAAGTNVENLLKRGFMALEESKWDEAKDFFNRVLDENVECAEAYLGKLMIEYKINEIEEFNNLYEAFEQNENYDKICRFDSSGLKEKMIGYSYSSKYNFACEIMNTAENENDYLEAAECFKEISEYSDSKEKVGECLNKYNEIVYSDANDIFNHAKHSDDYPRAIEKFGKIKGYSDSAEKIEICFQKWREATYSEAMKLYNSESVSKKSKAKNMFMTIKDYKDSGEKIKECEIFIHDFKKSKERREARIQEIKYRLDQLDCEEYHVLIVPKIIVVAVFIIAGIIFSIPLAVSSSASDTGIIIAVVIAPIVIVAVSLLVIIPDIKEIKRQKADKNEMNELEKELHRLEREGNQIN